MNNPKGGESTTVRTIDEILNQVRDDGYNWSGIYRHAVRDNSVERAKQAIAEWIKSKKPEDTKISIDKSVNEFGTTVEFVQVLPATADDYKKALLSELEGKDEGREGTSSLTHQ